MIIGKKKKKSTNRAGRRQALQRSGPSAEDLSNVVGLFGDPLYKEFAAEDEDYEDVHSCVCMLWNLAVLKSADPSEESSGLELAMVSLLRTWPFELEPSEAMNLIDLMCERWTKAFASYASLIVDHWVEADDDEEFYCWALGRRLQPVGAAAAGTSDHAAP